ncbi:LamG domain-containing protein, partial [Nanoarchaeota archaeon]
ITNWYLNSTSIMVLNMPFEANNESNESSWTKDYTNFSNHATSLNATWNSSGGYDGRGAYEFGGDQAILIANDTSLDITEEFTLAAWINAGSTGDYQTIISKHNGSYTDRNFWFVLWTDGQLTLRFSSSVSDSDCDIQNGGNLTDAGWTHVVATYDGSQCAVYIDGQLNTTDSTAASPEGLMSNITIGYEENTDRYFNGTIDAVMIFNRSLSAEQILLLYQNSTDVLANQETSIGDVWQACVTPNDGTEDGQEDCSNTLTVVSSNPLVNNVVLNATSNTNYSNENLTVHYDSSNDGGWANKNVTTWYVDDGSIMVLNMPFEGTAGNESSWTKDYTNLSNHGSVSGATWSSTGGFDGKGAYEFDGADGYIEIDANLSDTAGTISVWAKGSSLSATQMIVWAGQNGDGYGDKDEIHISTGNYDANLTFFVEGGSNDCSISEAATPTDNVWYHLVGTYNLNSRTCAFYINGVLVDTDTSGSHDSSNWDSKIYVGRESGDQLRNFNGTVDDLRIYSRSLPAEQVLALYQNRTDLIVSQETSVGEVWKACVTPNDGIEDGDENCSNTLTIRSANPAVSNVVLNSTYGTNYSNESLTVYYDSSNDLGGVNRNITNWYVNGTSFAVLNMPFEATGGNESSWANDYTNLSNDGTVYQAVWDIDGGHDGNGAYDFDGVDDYVEISNHPSLRGMSELTVAVWVYAQSKTNNDRIVEKTDNDVVNNNQTYRLRLDASGDQKVELKLWNASVASVIVTSNDALPLNTWVHVAATYDGANVKIYINGTLQSDVESLTGTVRDSDEAINTVAIGGSVGSSNRGLDGIIDEVLIFNRSLSAEQIQALHADGTDTIVPQETSKGEVWKACVTPNDGEEEGDENCSNTLTVRNVFPQVSDLSLDSYYGFNYSSDNLTVSGTVYDLDGDSVVNVTNWYVNGTSIMVLNMPFEAHDANSSDENVWAKDYSGNFSNDASVISATWNSTGGHDGLGAYNFSGSGQYLVVPDDPSLDLGASDWSISVWVYPRSVSGLNPIAGKIPSANDKEYAFSMYDDTIRVDIEQGGNDAAVVTDAGVISADRWYHLAATFVSSTRTVKIYVNGTENKSGTVAALPDVFTADFEIGLWGYSSSYFTGVIDDLQVYNRTLTPEQVLALYNDRTDLIVSDETDVGDVWMACLTPNDGTGDGNANCSNTLDVLETGNYVPTVSDVVLNSTYGNDYTTENLTVYYTSSDFDGGDVNNITNWYVNGVSIAVLNMPFEGTGGNESSWTKDYSGNNND